MPIRCTLVCASRSKHLSQVLTGFTLLSRAGAVRLSHEWAGDGAYSKESHMEADVEGRRVYYDMHDSGEIDEGAAERVALYFKRSYARERVPERLKAKVLPFGLNYRVLPDGFDAFELQRMLALRDHWKRECLTALEFLSRSVGRLGWAPCHVPTVRKMQAPPEPKRPPHVLFMTRAWDPAECSSKELREERERLNAGRARCVELLRREFRDAFTGGLEPTPYALERFPGLTIPDLAMTKQGAYLQELRRSPICVATSGLHGSNSWKIAEYVAFSKAIVSEPLNFEVPGSFRAGTHYLEFASPEACVEKAARLFQDDDLRAALMEANQAYYRAHLAPEALVARTLRLALGEAA